MAVPFQMIILPPFPSSHLWCWASFIWMKKHRWNIMVRIWVKVPGTAAGGSGGSAASHSASLEGWLGLQANGGGDGTQSLDGKSGSRSTHLHRQLHSWGVNWGGSWPSSCGSVDILHIPIQRCNRGYCISCMKASILYDLMCLNRKYLSTVSSKSLRRKNLPKDMLVLST